MPQEPKKLQSIAEHVEARKLAVPAILQHLRPRPVRIEWRKDKQGRAVAIRVFWPHIAGSKAADDFGEEEELLTMTLPLVDSVTRAVDWTFVIAGAKNVGDLLRKAGR